MGMLRSISRQAFPEAWLLRKQHRELRRQSQRRVEGVKRSMLSRVLRKIAPSIFGHDEAKQPAAKPVIIQRGRGRIKRGDA